MLSPLIALAALSVLPPAPPARGASIPARPAGTDSLPAAARDVLRAIAALRAADTVPNSATITFCKGRSAEQMAGDVGPWCRSVLRGRQPPDTSRWFVSARDDPATELARIDGHKSTVKPSSTVTCPSAGHRAGPGIGQRATVQFRWKTADSVHVDLILTCSEPEENRRRLGSQGGSYMSQEYIVVRRPAGWVVVGGETVVN